MNRGLSQQKRADWLALLTQNKAIAIIRAPSIEQGLAMAEAASAGGFRLIEVTWQSNYQPQQMAEVIRRAIPHCTVGAGSVLTQADLCEAITAGAQFCFTPHTDPQLIEIATEQEIPIVAGAMTPTEIVMAWRAGATSVKVFPITALGGATYIKSLKGPLGPIPLVPTGGVTSESAAELIAAGAVAVGLSTALFPRAEVQSNNWSAIEARSRYLLALLKK